MIDVHSHVYFPDYDADREETIRRAFAGGLTGLISVGTEPDDWGQALSITAYDERIWAAVGVHPHWMNAESSGENYELSKDALSNVVKKLRDFMVENNGKIVAIGECGLDYFSRADAPVSDAQKAFQTEGFLAQVKLAQELGLPLIIHTRPSAGSMDAYADMFEILARGRESGVNIPAILHCYVGDTIVTEQFLTLPDTYFSFTGTITYPVKKVLEGTEADSRRVVGMIPLERILTETDCPFLAPQSHRGERNEPGYVEGVIKKIAEIKAISTDEVEAIVEGTAKRKFGW